MAKTTDIPNPRGTDSFWEAYRACADKSNLSPNNDMVRAPETPSPYFSIMPEPYQKDETLVKILN
jgi:hypothetical protein